MVTDAREDFRAALEERKALFEAFHAHTKPDGPFYAEYNAAIKAAFKAKYGKKRYNFSKLDWTEPDFQAIRDEYQAKADALYDARKVKEDALDERLFELADQAPLSTEPTMCSLYRTHWSSTYGSQGYGAERYAKGQAILNQIHANHHSVTAFIVARVHSYGTGRSSGSYTNYEVWIEGDPLDVEILSRKTPVSLREQVRLSWKNGVNPRVYNPFLPHDFEARYGLDYHGGEKPDWKGKPSAQS